MTTTVQPILFGGVDGGASKTWAVVGDETGRLKGFGAAGSANYHVVGLDFAMRSVSDALKAAAAAAGANPEALSRAAFCLAGDDSRADHAALGEALARTFSPGLVFVWDNDCWAALRGGTEKAWGAVVIGGSGTNSAALGPDGRRAILRGLGWETGNPGGASDITRAALIQAFRMDEGSAPKTALHAEILKALELPDYDAAALEQRLAGPAFNYQAMGRVTPLVFDLATRGDPAAQDILVEIGRLMGEQTGAAMARAGIDRLEADVVLAGSVFRGRNPLLVDSLTLSLHRFAPGAKPRLPLHHPVIGAYLLALESTGVVVGPETHANLERTAPALLPAPAPGP